MLEIAAQVWASVLALVGLCAWMIAAICVAALAFVLATLIVVGAAGAIKAVWEALNK